MWKSERIAWGAGILALCVWIAGAGAGRIGAARALDEFDAARAAAQLREEPPDQALWSPERIKAWDEARKREAAPDALGVLSIPRLKIKAPVFPGTDDWALNRGLGLIDDTAKPGTDGNVGIAGH